MPFATNELNSSDRDLQPHQYGEEPESEALASPVDLRCKTKIAKNKFLSQGVWGPPTGTWVRRSDIQREPRIEPLLLLGWEETDEAVQDASWMSSCRGISGMTNWGKTQGQTKNKLEGLYSISYLAWKRLGTPQDELEDEAAEKDVCLASCYHDLDQISGRKLVVLYNIDLID